MTTHDETHDPTLNHAECEECNARLRRAFNQLADLDLGPKEASALIEKMRELANAAGPAA